MDKIIGRGLKLVRKNWWVFALIFILFFAYWIRSFNIVPDKLLGYDPDFQYRFTRYFADWGHLPAWDELTYYVGREINSNMLAPLMFYLTAILFWIFNPLFGFSLLTTASYASAIYGAMIVIPAFLLGRELSNKYGGLLAAALIGTAPQIMVRTFGGSYDTDQMALFFIPLTIYLGYYALKKRSVGSIALASLGFVAFMLAWGMFTYSFFVLGAFAVVNFFVEWLWGSSTWVREGEKTKIAPRAKERLQLALKGLKSNIIVLASIFAVLVAIGLITGGNPIGSSLAIIGFAGSAEKWIVNISIAELQAFNIFNLQGWVAATGNFRIGETFLDALTFMLFVLFMLFGLAYAFGKKESMKASFLLTLFAISVYTTFRGVRFTEFTSALFIIIIAAGFGLAVEYARRDSMLKILTLGAGLWISFVAMGIGMQVGQNLGPDNSPSWDAAWNFIRTQTPETAIIGTWWDPGHMIATRGERRNFADGAHCDNSCMYTINDRITDLGKIMATTDENESLRLINKYKGTSERAYWIASDDLIGKYQWLQYFGTGCDARSDASCQMYILLGRTGVTYDQNGNPILIFKDSSGSINSIVFFGEIPFPVLVQGRDAMMYKEMIYYDGAYPKTYSFESMNETKRQALSDGLKQYNLRLSNQTVPLTAWIPSNYGYVTLIPDRLKNTVFTRMFFLEGQGLEHFKQVFRNEQVKIYEVIF
ncbi:MAG: STT3 domain-containing protein [Candidatus Aenigmatarchaeota archaeon]